MATVLSKAKSKGKRENAAVLFGAPKRKLIAVDSEELVDDGVAPLEDSMVQEDLPSSSTFQSTPRTYGKRVAIEDIR